MKRVLLAVGALLLVAAAPTGDQYLSKRLKMVQAQIEFRGIKNERVLDAMRRVPRHLFVPLQHREEAYDERLDQIESLLASSHFADADMAWTLELASEVCLRVREDQRAQRALALATEQLKSLRRLR